MELELQTGLCGSRENVQGIASDWTTTLRKLNLLSLFYSNQAKHEGHVYNKLCIHRFVKT